MHCIKEGRNFKIKYFENRCEKPRLVLESSTLGLGQDCVQERMEAGEIKNASRSKWVPPSQDGSVCTHTDDVPVFWTYPDAHDVATVSHPNVSHFTLIIIPNFDQMVMSTWKTITWHGWHRRVKQLWPYITASFSTHPPPPMCWLEEKSILYKAFSCSKKKKNLCML